MSIKQSLTNVFAIALTLAALFLALGYIFLAISVNSGRIDQLREIQSEIQKKVDEITSAQPTSNAEQILRDLSDLYQKRNNATSQQRFGDGRFWDLSFAKCVLPLDPNCFHRNSTEQNNMWLAVASGALGGVLFVLLSLQRSKILTAPNNQGGSQLFSIFAVFVRIITGMLMGLLTYFILRGTQIAALTPVTDVVQIDSPYGIAFACTAAALFSDRVFSILSKFADSVGLREDSDPPVKVQRGTE